MYKPCGTNNLYSYALLKKLPYEDFDFVKVPFETTLSTNDDSDVDYWTIYYLEQTDEYEERRNQFFILLFERTIDDDDDQLA